MIVDIVHSVQKIGKIKYASRVYYDTADVDRVEEYLKQMEDDKFHHSKPFNLVHFVTQDDALSFSIAFG